MTREEAREIFLNRGFVNGLFDGDKWRQSIVVISEWLEQQPTAKENLVVGDCISREFIEIVVDYPPADLCTYPEYKGKPYFSIKYRENGKTYVGFGTYKIEMLSQWIKEYFISDTQPKTGHWISDKNGQYCDKCGNGIKTPYNFCPFCGADMREYTKE